LLLSDAFFLFYFCFSGTMQGTIVIWFRAFKPIWNMGMSCFCSLMPDLKVSCQALISSFPPQSSYLNLKLRTLKFYSKFGCMPLLFLEVALGHRYWCLGPSWLWVYRSCFHCSIPFQVRHSFALAF
jgi:hypothetical protein